MNSIIDADMSSNDDDTLATRRETTASGSAFDADSQMTPHEIQRKKLKFRSWHRGCKETDLILGHFSDRFLDGMTQDELDDFATVLDLDDADLYRWYTREQTVPANLLTPMLERVLAFDIHAIVQQPSNKLDF